MVKENILNDDGAPAIDDSAFPFSYGWPNLESLSREICSPHMDWIRKKLMSDSPRCINLTEGDKNVCESLNILINHLFAGRSADSVQSEDDIAIKAANIFLRDAHLIETSGEMQFFFSFAYKRGGVENRRGVFHNGGVLYMLSGIPVISVAGNAVSAPGSHVQDRFHWLFIRPEDINRLENLIRDTLNEVIDDSSYLITCDPARDDISMTQTRVRPQEWDNLTFDPVVSAMLRDDVRNFFERERWFKSKNLPFRRGYLLHGPPGNGKTSAIRVIMNEWHINAYALRLYHPKTMDTHLDRLFSEATHNSPCIVVFEDLDRAFPKTGEQKTNLSMQSLLNHLDGIATHNGIIVIATANEPTILDKAILKRPGRFDRVIFFDNPSHDLRKQYFQKLVPDVQENVITRTDGFSFAQLQETYVMAGQVAFENGREEIFSHDLLWAVDVLRNNTNLVNKKPDGRGFQKSQY